VLNLTQQVQIKKKNVPEGYHYLQQAVTPKEALPSENISQHSRGKKPSEDITWRLFLMNMKGVKGPLHRSEDPGSGLLGHNVQPLLGKDR
jgi:hypothetical protein